MNVQAFELSLVRYDAPIPYPVIGHGKKLEIPPLGKCTGLSDIFPVGSLVMYPDDPPFSRETNGFQIEITYGKPVILLQ